MEKFTKPELLSFLCDGELDNIAGTSPVDENDILMDDSWVN